MIKKKIELKPLYEFSSNVYSQNGEDGILEYLFNQFDIDVINKKYYTLEVGAADGKWCSNIRNLYEKNENIGAILIEADTNSFKNLINNTKNIKNTEIFNKFLISNKNSQDSINKIIKSTKFYKNNFEFLCSIDIDGEDYNIWKSLSLRPLFLIIEVPIFLENHDKKKNIVDYIKLGIKKKYTFIGMSGIKNKQAGNMFFIDDRIKNDIEFSLFPLEQLILLEGGTECKQIIQI